MLRTVAVVSAKPVTMSSLALISARTLACPGSLDRGGMFYGGGGRQAKWPGVDEQGPCAWGSGRVRGHG